MIDNNLARPQDEAETQQFADVKSFKNWFETQVGSDLLSLIPEKGYSASFDGLIAITLCRRGTFVAELLIGEPGNNFKTIATGKDEMILQYHGGHVRALYNSKEITNEWNPDIYNNDTSNNWFEKTAEGLDTQFEINAQNILQFSFGEKGERGMLLSYSYGDYSSYLSGLELMSPISI